MLPAWSARSLHDLTDPGLGFGTAVGVLAPGDQFKAKQAAMARYGREGFEAAAVSAAGALLSATVPREGRIRTAELRFGHPFAVVAVTVDAAGRGRRRARADGPWHGLPVFSAWVTQPEDPQA